MSVIDGRKNTARIYLWDGIMNAITQLNPCRAYSYYMEYVHYI